MGLVVEILNDRGSIGNDVMQAPPPDAIRILLVDDSQDDYRLLCDLLDAVTDVTYAIDWVNDLSSGRDRLDNGRFDVCLIDHRLPDGDGLELLETAAVRQPAPPMILLTGQATAKLDRQAMALGASGFLDKCQLAPSLLERTIRYAMRQRTIIDNLAQATLRDSTTGLVTQLLFEDRLARALAAAKRRQTSVALMLIDLGDSPACETDRQRWEERLTAQAKHLVRQLRDTDTVARLADRRIALIFEGLAHSDDAAVIAQKVLDGMMSSAVAGDEPPVIDPHAGIAIHPEDCRDCDTMMRQAEAAMRRAKTEGGQRYRFSGRRTDQRVRRQFLRSNDLAHALDQRALTLRYRPMVHVADTTISLTAEVYSNLPDSKHIRPNQFRSIAHDRSLIAAMIDWIAGEAMAQLLTWRHQGFDKVDLSLPFISARPADLPLLERSIRQHLSETPVDPGQIEIDLDQSLVIGDLASGGHGLAALKKTGVRLALDDFGRSHAGFNDLRSDLLDGLKLSPKLYQDLPGKATHETLMKSIVSLGHDLDLRVSANGARDERQFAFLKNIGCDAIKLLGAKSSLTADMFTHWLKKTKPSSMPGKSDIVVTSRIESNRTTVSPAAMARKAQKPLPSLDMR